MLGGQLFERTPVHPLGFPSVAVEDARLPSQLVSDSVRPPCRPIIPGLPLAGIGQLIAATTGEDTATIEDCDATTAATSRTKEPGALPSKVTGRPVEMDRVAFILPIIAAAAVAVGEDYPVLFGAYADRCNYLTTV